jgi:hypothetical protein
MAFAKKNNSVSTHFPQEEEHSGQNPLYNWTKK